jgi:hypothetical protein
MAKTRKLDFLQAARGAEYRSAINDLQKICGAAPREMKEVKGGFALRVKGKSFKLEKVQADFLKRGCFVFGTDTIENDRIAALPTTDKYDVVLAMQTSGPNWNITTQKVIAWLRKLEKTQPFILTGASHEHIRGRFTTRIKDVEELAMRILDFSPDLDNFDELLTKLPRTGQFMLWWT